MKLKLTRESVAMGDDVDAPHEESLKVPSGSTLQALLEAVIRSGYLPVVRGRATWSVLDGKTPLAVISQEWDAPRYIAAPETRYDGPSLHLHFDYESQQAPEIVFDVQRAAAGASGASPPPASAAASRQPSGLVFTASHPPQILFWIASGACFLVAATSIGFAFVNVDRIAGLGPNGSAYIGAAALTFVVSAVAGFVLFLRALQPPRRSFGAIASRQLGVGQIVEEEDARHRR